MILSENIQEWKTDLVLPDIYDAYQFSFRHHIIFLKNFRDDLRTFSMEHVAKKVLLKAILPVFPNFPL